MPSLFAHVARVLDKLPPLESQKTILVLGQELEILPLVVVGGTVLLGLLLIKTLFFSSPPIPRIEVPLSFGKEYNAVVMVVEVMADGGDGGDDDGQRETMWR